MEEHVARINASVDPRHRHITPLQPYDASQRAPLRHLHAGDESRPDYAEELTPEAKLQRRYTSVDSEAKNPVSRPGPSLCSSRFRSYGVTPGFVYQPATSNRTWVVPVLLYRLTFPPVPSLTVTWLGTVWPALKLRFDTSGSAAPVG